MLYPLSKGKLRHNIVKVAVEPQATGEWFHSEKLMKGKRHKKLKSICFFRITRPQNGQMPGINKRKRRRKLAVNKDK